MANKTVKPNDLVRVYKNMVGGLGFSSANGTSKHWEDSREFYDFIFSDLEYFVSNNLNKFFRNELIIKDEIYRQALNLPILDEYLDKSKIKEILNSNDYGEIDNMVATSTDSELEIITDTVIKEGTTDRNVLQIIESYTGIEDMQDIADESKVDNNTNKQEDNDKPTRRQKVK